MRTRIFLTLVAFSSLPFVSSLCAQSGNLSIISGLLQTEDGKRVDAIVRATRIKSAPSVPGRTTLAPTQPQHVRVSAKDKDGSFSFSGLDSGMYELCATVTAGGYLDPCLWENTGVLVNLPPLQIVQSVAITLKKASAVRAHVIDPGHLIRNSPQGHLLIGVFGPHNRFYPMTFQSADSQSRDYTLPIPFDRDLKFHVRPVGISAVDGNNASIDDGATITLHHNNGGAPPPPLNFRITGKK